MNEKEKLFPKQNNFSMLHEQVNTANTFTLTALFRGESAGWINGAGSCINYGNKFSWKMGAGRIVATKIGDHSKTMSQEFEAIIKKIQISCAEFAFSPHL